MINKDKKYHLLIHLIGFLFFGALLFICWIFYKERMLNIDPASFCFQIIQSKTYLIAVGRWPLVLTQLLPVAFINLHCSLEIFLKVYSISFILIYYLAYLICTLVLKNYRGGMALMLVLCLGFRWVFYYATCELFLGFLLAILLWCIISHKNPYSSAYKKWLSTIVSLFLIYTLSYCHQITLFMIVFVVLLELIGNKRWKDLHLWTILLLTFVWYFIRIKFLTTSSYETAKMDGMDDFFYYLPNLFTLSSWRYLNNFLTETLWVMSIIFLFCLIIALIRKKLLLFIYSLLYFCGYYLFLAMMFAQSVDEIFLQYYSIIFGFMTGVLFMYLVYDFIPKHLSILLVAIILSLNVYGIYKSHDIPTERINYKERLTHYGQRFSNKKFLINTKNVPGNIVQFSHFLPYETILYTALQSPDSAQTFFVANKMDEYDSLITKQNAFLSISWNPDLYHQKDFDKNYYRLPSSGYIKLNTSQADTSFKESYFNKDNISLIPQKQEIHSGFYNFIVAPIKIINTSIHTINSTPEGDHPVYLSYHLLDQNGALLSSDNTKTILEVDIKDQYTQGLMVYLPPHKGNYIIEVDFITEGIRWWNTTARFNLIVE